MSELEKRLLSGILAAVRKCENERRFTIFTRVYPRYPSKGEEPVLRCGEPEWNELTRLIHLDIDCEIFPSEAKLLNFFAGLGIILYKDTPNSGLSYFWAKTDISRFDQEDLLHRLNA